MSDQEEPILTRAAPKSIGSRAAAPKSIGSRAAAPKSAAPKSTTPKPASSRTTALKSTDPQSTDPKPASSRTKALKSTGSRAMGLRDVSFDGYEFSLIQKMYNVYRTVLEMLRDRGYEIGNLDKFLGNYDIRGFIDHFSSIDEQSFPESLEGTFKKEGSMIRIFFPRAKIDKGEPKIGKDQIKPITEYIIMKEIPNSIIITQVMPSPSALDDLNSSPSFNIQHFVYDELSFNVTKHFLVPKHTLLSPEEVDQLTQSTDKVQLDKLPTISTLDPISKYYGAIQGNVFSIDRFNVLANTMISQTKAYRHVMNVPLIPDIPKKSDR